MTHLKVYEKYAEKLVKALPMDDVTFTTKLCSSGLLPGGIDANIKSLGSDADKADFFLKKVVKAALDIDDNESFITLLKVMKECGYRHIKNLANKMNSYLEQLEGLTTITSG